MLKIRYYKQFKKDYKRIVKRGYNKKLFEEVLSYLVNEKQLPKKYRDHSLSLEITKVLGSVIFSQTGF